MEKDGAGPLAQLNMEKIKAMLAHCHIKHHQLEQLPNSFVKFMKERGLDLNELTIPIPRYVRTKPAVKITTQELAEALEVSADSLVQIEPHYWAVNPDIKISKCPLYEKGLLYGMDYSSAVAVKCMALEKDMEVLELCSAPGNKAMLMADSEQVQVTGVEINENRANVMRNLVKKYDLSDRVKIIVGDAVNFEPEKQFDRVLVDAQCTHEGSLKHIFKFMKQQQHPVDKAQQKLTKQQEKQFRRNNSNPYTSQIRKGNKWSQQDFQERFLDTFKLKHLNQLQLGLLRNAVKCVKEGGLVIYSTCSFDPSQNQHVVEQTLKEREGQFELLDALGDQQCAVGWQPGLIQGTVRLSPSVSQCGGMFIAKMRRRHMMGG